MFSLLVKGWSFEPLDAHSSPAVPSPCSPASAWHSTGSIALPACSSCHRDTFGTPVALYWTIVSEELPIPINCPFAETHLKEVLATNCVVVPQSGALSTSVQ